MTTSLWGKVHCKYKIKTGVNFVRTASHGGFLISKKLAEKTLSSAALKRAEFYGNNYCFEEDCLADIILLEIPEARSFETVIPEDTETIIRRLSRWLADYLIEIGITPSKPEYETFLLRRLDQKLRTEKSDKLVIAACCTDNPAIVKVWTAADNIYYVTRESYNNREHNYCILLEKLQVVSALMVDQVVR